MLYANNLHGTSTGNRGPCKPHPMGTHGYCQPWLGDHLFSLTPGKMVAMFCSIEKAVSGERREINDLNKCKIVYHNRPTCKDSSKG